MKKALSMVLAVLMLISVLPLSALAAVDLDLTTTSCDYYNLIEKTDYNLAPGAVESQFVLNDDTGSRRQVVHVIEVDTKNPNISVMPSFKNIDNGVDYTDTANWGSITVTDHAAHAENDLGKNVIGGMNVSLSWAFTHPYGLLMYEGEVLHDSRLSCDVCGTGHPGGGYLVIKKDGTAQLRDAKAPLEEDDWMAQTVCFNYLVRNGVNMHTAEDHTGEGAPRSVIGIKADGTLVLMMVDGRMLPYSEGFTNHEMAQMMIALGCVDAINCDGGGSSTFMTEREGTGELSVKSRYSDGSERQTLTAILVCSTATADGVFDHAAITCEDKLVTPGSTVKFSAAGADSAGGPAQIPAEVTWQLSDPAMGTIQDGEFVSNGTVGTATAQMVYEGEVVGEASVDVVIPDSISLDYPNMTAPYGKSISLDVSAKYGNSPVTIKGSDLEFTLENNSIGSISGATFTAVTDAVENPVSGLTVTLVHNRTVTATGSITLGRGSEIVYDFESGAQSIANWYLSYKDKYTPENYYFNDQFSVVSASEGKVRNGEYALRVTSDGDSITCMNWCQTRINGMNIDLTDAVSLSFWMYIPEGSHGYEWDFGNAIPVELGHWLKYGTGWQYFTVNVADIGTNVTNLNQIKLYHSDTNNTGIGYEHNKAPNYYADAVFYIDDITVNYSSAVDDNQAPEISDVKISYEGVDTAVEMTGQTLPTNTVAFTANAKDNYSGLDVSTVSVYVDGVQVAASCSDTGMISTGDITLANGGHTVRIQICDKMGNASTFKEYYFALAGDSDRNTISYVPADPTLQDVPEDSLVWMNLEATAIENVDMVTAVIDLDQNSKWELEHVVLAEGFAMSYCVDGESNDATITITKTGEVSATGNAVLASLPVRVWSPVFHHDGTSGNEDASAYRLVSVISHVEQGVLTETDGAVSSFASLEQVTSTEWNGTRLKNGDKNGYHIHTAEAMEDTAATCTVNGYTDRTFCAGCNSVVDWGITATATGHDYQDVDGVLMCSNSCGKLFSGEKDGKIYLDGVLANGWVEDTYYCVDGVKVTGYKILDRTVHYFDEEGKYDSTKSYSGLINWGTDLYYAINNKFISGWQYVDGDYYYFSSTNQKAANGERTVGGYHYRFEDYKLVEGQWAKSSDGEHLKYMWAGRWCKNQWITVDGVSYCFDGKAYAYIGVQKPTNHTKYYVFDETGAWLANYTGEYTWNGKDYYVIDGIAVYGLVEIDGYYYYVRSNGKFATGKYYTTTTNGLLPADHYTFAADGRMLNPPGTELIEDGIHKNENGVLCYYKDGVPFAAGLIEIDGNYYYARTGGVLAIGKYWTTKTNGLMEAKLYTFAEDGKMVMEGSGETGKTGVYQNEAGVWYYYKNGEPFAAGLIEIDGNYYYARTGGVLAIGKYWTTKTNGLMEAKLYTFDETGKMVVEGNEETGKTGVYQNEAGVWYYYKNGKPFAAGLIQIDGNYYYARTGGILAIGGYWTTNTNNLLPAAYYQFDDSGKMLNPPVVNQA